MLDLQECQTIEVLPVCDLLKSGRLPGRKVGGQWRFPVEGLRRYLTAPGTTSVSETKAD